MPVFLIPILLHLRSLVSGAASWIARNPWVAACIALALWGALERHEAHKWATVAAQRGNALNDAAKASKAELARATAEHDAAAKHQKEANDATDKRVSQARADDARGLADYERRLRAGSGQGHGGAVPAAGEADMAQGSDRSGVAPVMDETLSADLSICTDNSRRLAEIHTQAIADGLAIEGVN